MHRVSGEGSGASRPITANERFKARSRTIFGGAVLASVAVHGLVFWLSPDVDIARRHRSISEMMALAPPLDVEPTPAPPAYVSPPIPGIHGHPVARAITRPEEPIVEPEADARVVDLLEELLADGPRATPYEIAPMLKNREATIKALARLYPEDATGLPDLARADVWFLIDEIGTVRKTLIKASTGYAVLDDAVLKAATMMKFTPAWAGDRTIPVWVSIPIVFHNQPPDVGQADTASAAGLGAGSKSLARHP